MTLMKVDTRPTRTLSYCRAYENVATILAMVGTCLISFFAKDSNFALVFGIFLISAVILSYTMFIKKEYAIMRLQLFFVMMNSFALIKEII